MARQVERSFDYGPQRSSWQFQVSTWKLKEAAERRVKYHTKRLGYWKGELVTATKAVKDSTELRTHQVTGGVQTTAVVDQEKSNYMNTCSSKVASHREMLLHFAEWAELCSTKDEGWVNLTIEDAKHFRLSDVEVDDE